MSISGNIRDSARNTTVAGFAMLQKVLHTRL
jgi:hypothetical protein